MTPPPAPSPPPAVARVLSKVHAGLYRVTGGRLGTSLAGVPVVLLTHIGRKTGTEYTTPVMKIELSGEVHVIASNSGSTTSPSWYRNVAATPVVQVQDGTVSYTAKAEELVGEERDAVYEAAKLRMDNFVTYERTAGRTIPVIRLHRVE